MLNFLCVCGSRASGCETMVSLNQPIQFVSVLVVRACYVVYVEWIWII